MKMKTIQVIDELIAASLEASATLETWAYIDERYLGDDRPSISEVRADRDMMRNLVFEMCQPHDPQSLVGTPLLEALRLPR